MSIAHCLKDGEWIYIRCYKDGYNWIDYYTNKVIDKRIIYRIE